MRSRSLRRAATLGVAGLVALLASARAEADLVVNPGYDLFTTVTPGTNFNGVDFQGVPLGFYDFGGSIGVQNVDGADTIVQRLQTASVAAPGVAAPIAIQMVALQLETVAPTTAFGPLDNYFITLQSARGGPASTGTMTITFGPDPGPPPPNQPVAGTFSSSIDVAFDIRKGSLNGAIVFSDTLTLTNTDTPWSHFPPPGATELVGVNSFLNGRDHNRDFFPIAPFTEKHPTAGQHEVVEAGTSLASVPEPSVVATGAISLAFGAVLVWRSRTRAS